MKILPMYENAPGTLDLVYHTAKHFLADDEASNWDQVPAGTLSAKGALAQAVKDGLRPPPTGRDVDVRWWWPPWRALARDAHDRGYQPRYDLLLSHAPDPRGPRWEPAAKERRVMEYLGFRLVLEPRAEDWQVITAFFSPSFRDASDLPRLVPALRAFAVRKNCPPGGVTGVGGRETKS
jgi:hypothetical protein